MKLSQLFHLPVMLLLRSRVGGSLFPDWTVLTIRGRKTQKRYRVPVGLVRVNGSYAVMSRRDRKWWRNLVGGAPLRLLLHGREAEGFGQAYIDDRAVAEGLRRYLERLPKYARYFGVALDGNGRPVEEDIEREAKTRVFVSIRLEGAGG